MPLKEETFFLLLSQEKVVGEGVGECLKLNNIVLRKADPGFVAYQQLSP